MNLKEQAYHLFNSGCSYKQIADQLRISKSTAHGYVKNLQNGSDNQPNANNEKLHPNVRSERTNGSYVRKRKEKPSIDISKIKVFTGNQLLEKEFIGFPFEGRFLKLIGKPSRPFAGLIWGAPKSGKSNLSIRFADYLSEYFGRVCYIASEEGESATLQLKIRDIGGSDMIIVAISDGPTIEKYLETEKFDFVFIDSLNYAQVDHLFLEELKQGNPNTSFIGILQATKDGNFKGDQAFTHNCDFIIKVENGIAYQQGRFNTNSEIEIFKKHLYVKNPNKVTEIIPEVEEIKVEIENTSVDNPHIEAEIIEETKLKKFAFNFKNVGKQIINKPTTKEKLRPINNFIDNLIFEGLKMINESILEGKSNNDCNSS